MRGGAIPVLAWAGILALLFAGNWVWTGDPIQVAELGFAVLAIALSGVALVAARGEAIRRGAPRRLGAPESLPDLSLGAAGVGVAVACIAFGLAFGHFLVYFGCGLLLASLGRVAVELRAARLSARRVRGDLDGSIRR